MKLQKGEQQLNGVWGRKHQLYGDPIQGSQSKLSKAFSHFKYSCKVTSEYLCNHSKRHKQNSRSSEQSVFKKRNKGLRATSTILGEYHATTQITPLTRITNTRHSNCFESFFHNPLSPTVFAELHLLMPQRRPNSQILLTIVHFYSVVEWNVRKVFKGPQKTHQIGTKT